MEKEALAVLKEAALDAKAAVTAKVEEASDALTTVVEGDRKKNQYLKSYFKAI